MSFFPSTTTSQIIKSAGLTAKIEENVIINKTAILAQVRMLDPRVVYLVVIPDKPLKQEWMSLTAYEILMRAVGCNWDTVVRHSIINLDDFLRDNFACKSDGNSKVAEILAEVKKLGYELLGPQVDTDGKVWVVRTAKAAG